MAQRENRAMVDTTVNDKLVECFFAEELLDVQALSDRQNDDKSSVQNGSGVPEVLEEIADKLVFEEHCHVDRAQRCLRMNFKVFLAIVEEYAVEYKPAKKECDLIKNLPENEILKRYTTKYNHMMQYCSKVIESNGVVIVNYKYSESQKGSGRIYAIGPSLQNLPSCVRNFLCKDVADIDMASAHPRFALQLAGRWRLKLPALVQYIEDRGKFLEETGASKDFCTACMFRDRRLNKKELSTLKSPKLVMDLDRDFKLIQSCVYDENPYGVELNTKSNNPMGSMLSKTLVVEENKSLQAMIRYFESIGKRCETPMFDGVTVSLGSTGITDEMLRCAEEYSFSETGFSIKLVRKPIETVMTPQQAVDFHNGTEVIEFATDRDEITWPEGVLYEEKQFTEGSPDIDFFKNDNPFENARRCIGISAGMGRGKSKAMKNLVDRVKQNGNIFKKKDCKSNTILKKVAFGFTKDETMLEKTVQKLFKNRNARILTVSCRQQHAKTLKQLLGDDFNHYATDGVLDEKNPLFRTVDRLIIQPQSLWKLQATASVDLTTLGDGSFEFQDNFEPYDLVILDEIHSILCSAAWMREGVSERHDSRNVEILRRLVGTAGKVVVMDADLLVDPICKTFLTSILEPSEIHIQRYPQPRNPRTFLLERSEEKFKQEILAAVKENKGLVWIACATKKYAEKIEGIVAGMLGGREFIKLYTGDSSSAVMNDFLDINVALENIRVVICTSAVTVGADVHVPANKVFVQLAMGGASATDLRQMTGRCRRLLNSEVVVFIGYLRSYYSPFESRYQDVMISLLDKSRSNDAARQQFGKITDLSRFSMETRLDGCQILRPDAVCSLYLQKMTIDAEDKLWAFCSMAVHAGSKVFERLPIKPMTMTRMTFCIFLVCFIFYICSSTLIFKPTVVKREDAWESAVLAVPDLMSCDNYLDIIRDSKCAISQQRSTLKDKAVSQYGEFVVKHSITAKEMVDIFKKPNRKQIIENICDYYRYQAEEVHKKIEINDISHNTTAVHFWTDKLLSLCGAKKITDCKTPIDPAKVAENYAEIEMILEFIMPQTYGYVEWKRKNRAVATVVAVNSVDTTASVSAQCPVAQIVSPTKKLHDVEKQLRRALKVTYGITMRSIRTTKKFEYLGTARCTIICMNPTCRKVAERGLCV